MARFISETSTCQILMSVQFYLYRARSSELIHEIERFINRISPVSDVASV